MSHKRTALVTGSARGIGQAIAKRLAADGFCVVIADIDKPAARETAEQIAAGDPTRAFALRVDVSDPASVQALVAEVLDRRGQIDVLVNNAGIVGAAQPVATYPIADWRRIMSINLDGVFYCCQAALPSMLQHGSGRIINMASISGKEGNPGLAAYSTSKAGVIGLTKSLAKEVATRGILVNCITPAIIETELLQQMGPEVVATLVAKIPMGRPGQPAEVAALVSWLASNECTFSTGAVFDLSGGRATY
ncbi:MAG: SDR family NAD(P)-dependent oxidoreductase [Thermoflexales bacterium]